MKLGNFFKFLYKYPLYTDDKFTRARGRGYYTQDDWGMTRKKNDIFFSDPNLENYQKSIEERKVEATNYLISNYNFSDYNHLCDLGGAPFYQAIEILKKFPSLKATLTDYDTKSMSSIKELNIFKKYKLIEFDIQKQNIKELGKADIYTMWGVDFGLSDQDLIILIDSIVSIGGHLIIASVQSRTAGLNFFKYFLINRIYNPIKCFLRGYRRIGFARSTKYFTKLTKFTKANITHLGSKNMYSFTLYKKN